jgi:GTP cyclohydrolase I
MRLSCGYVPAGQVVGLSKIVRIAQAAAHRLQLQERITAQVAEAVAEVTASPDVGVRVTGEHLCMSMRGIRAPAARTTTECLLGRLRSDPALTERILSSAGSQ